MCVCWQIVSSLVRLSATVHSVDISGKLKSRGRSVSDLWQKRQGTNAPSLRRDNIVKKVKVISFEILEVRLEVGS